MERTMLADTLTPESERVPEWARGAVAYCEDEGTDNDGEYGYECWRLQRGGTVVGWVYDTGDGYDWSEGSRPEPYDDYARYGGLASLNDC